MNDRIRVAVQIATSDEEVPPGARWQDWIIAALDAATIDAQSAGCVTLRLVGRQESQYLNEMYRHKLGPTNVLAFSGRDDEGPSGAERELGDLVICLPMVNDEAVEQGKTPLAHLAHLIVHGTLHLAGYDHDDEGAAERMESLETKAMVALDFPPPYETGSDAGADRTLKHT